MNTRAMQIRGLQRMDMERKAARSAIPTSCTSSLRTCCEGVVMEL